MAHALGKVVSYQDKADEYRATIEATNGNKIVATTEGYIHPEDRDRALEIAYFVLKNWYEARQ